MGNEKPQRWEIKSDIDGNFPGDTDRKYLLEKGKSTRQVLGDTVGKWKSHTDGKRFSPDNWLSTNPFINLSTKGVSGDKDGKNLVFLSMVLVMRGFYQYGVYHI